MLGIDLGLFSSFEALLFLIKGKSLILYLMIYKSPTNNSTSVGELAKLLFSEILICMSVPWQLPRCEVFKPFKIFNISNML